MRDVALRSVDEGLALDADFAFELTPRLAEVVANGVPLYFRVDFELTRSRWYWFDETAASRRLQLRLSYHALSRQYRLSTGALQQSFPTLEEALDVLKRVRNWLVVDRTVRLSGRGLRGGGAHAARHGAAAQAVPALGADRPRPAARVGLEAVHRAPRRNGSRG